MAESDGRDQGEIAATGPARRASALIVNDHGPDTSRVLIVDDDAFHNSVLRRWLASEGFTSVETLTDGSAVKDRLSQTDLLILDLNMPGLDGFEVIAHLREFRSSNFLPVLVLTGDHERESRVRALAAGASDFLTKPIDQDEARARIGNLITARALYRANRAEREKYANLLATLLPGHIISRLNAGERHVADRISKASVLFADLVGFTSVCATQPPEAVVEIVGDIFAHFDELLGSTGIEKIKTVGDAYMAVGGLSGRQDHAEAIADLALKFQKCVHELPAAQRHKFTLRIGIHVGDIIAGVLPGLRPAFDVWGDTVNTAARLQVSGEPDTITVSAGLAAALPPRFHLVDRGPVDIKGKSPIPAYYLKTAAEGHSAA